MLFDLLVNVAGPIAAKRFKPVRAALWIIFAVGLLVMLAANAWAEQIPDVVRQLADSYAQSHPSPEKLAPGRTVQAEYAANFFMGFTHPRGGIYNSPPLADDAYKSGQAYWRDHPSEREQIFSGYGYTRVEAEGVWERRFEVSAFVPSNAPGERWWMTTLGQGPWREVGIDLPNTLGSFRVRIAGYLSQSGRYGHMGAYGHEVLVTSGTVTGPATSAP